MTSPQPEIVISGKSIVKQTPNYESFRRRNIRITNMLRPIKGRRALRFEVVIVFNSKISRTSIDPKFTVYYAI